MPAEHNHPFRRLELLTLNRDVLKTITDSCPPLDALSLAMTCKPAYELAMPRALSDISIGQEHQKGGPGRLLQFCTFLLDKPKERMRHVRALRLHEGAFGSWGRRGQWQSDFSSADLLVEVLRQVENLRVIHIRDGNGLIVQYPSVREAIAALTSLTEFSFYYIGNATLDLMRQMRSTPAVIENGLWKDGPRPTGDITPFSFVVPSLRRLKLWECGCMLESVINRHVWADVHTLDIGGRIAKLSELARAFPNLRRLTFFREFSVKQEDEGPAPAWAELDLLVTSQPIPWFCSPARRVELTYVLKDANGGASPSAASARLKTLPMLEKANPVAFACTLAQPVHGAYLDRLRAAMPSIRFAEITLSSGSSIALKWPTFAEWVDQNLGLINPRLFGLCLGYEDYASAPTLATYHENAEGLAHKLAAALPQLQYVGVALEDLGPEERMICTWYRVVRGGDEEEGEVELERLSAWEGERTREMLQNLPRE